MKKQSEGHPIYEGMPELTNCSAPLPSDALGRISMFVLGFICGVVALLAILMVSWGWL